MTRLAVVTGANKGIGFAIAQNLCKQFDGKVLLCSRDVGRGQAAVDKLVKQGLSPVLHQLDITDPESIRKLKKTIEDNGGLDVLVNNAAIAYDVDSKVPFVEQATNTIKVNFFALVDICKELFPLLRPHARVVNVSSSAGMLSRCPDEKLRKRYSDPNLTVEGLCQMMKEYLEDVKNGVHEDKGWPRTAYGTSKIAVSALSFIQNRQFEKDSREDIVVNAVHPGILEHCDMSRVDDFD